jgi:hypothetical protein
MTTLGFERVIIAVFVALVGAVLVRSWLRSQPALRESLSWAVRSWIIPPDAAAGWEQNRECFW